MKFVCDSCQAKYQIGDEKVAGKTVRMKCRRCGHEIRVRAGLATEAGETAAVEASSEMDAPAPLPSGSTAPSAAPPSASSTAVPAPGPAEAGMAPQRVPIGVMAPRPFAAPRPAGAVAAAPRPPSAPRPVSVPVSARPASVPVSARTVSAPVSARPVTRGPGASSAALAAVRPLVEDAAPASSAPQAVRSTWGEVEDESTALFSMAHAPHHAAASAFSSAPLPVTAVTPAVETGDADWYVGIAGTPLGPVYAAVIRDRALAGEVDGDSLVWREGLAEWRALKTFPELVQMIAAAQQAAPYVAPPYAAPEAAPYAAPYAPIAPPAAPSPAPQVAPVSAPRSALAAPFSHASHASPAPGPSPQSAQNGKSNGYHAAPLQPAPGAAVPDEAPRAQPAPAAALVPAVEAPAAQPIAGGAAPAAGAAASAGPKVEIANDLDLVLGRKRGGTHPMAYAFIAAAAVFGGVAAFVLLTKPPPQIVVVQQAATVVGTAAASGAPSAEAQVEVGDISAANPQGAGARTGGPPGGPRPKPSSTATATSGTPIDTSGFNSSVPGPAATAQGAQPGGGGQLSQGEIGAVVSQNQPLVKRKCWQPALEARAANGPSSVRVSGSINIGASGQVETASASGGERDFPGLSSCIATRMKTWKFPPSGSPSSVNVPFFFAGQ